MRLNSSMLWKLKLKSIVNVIQQHYYFNQLPNTHELSYPRQLLNRVTRTTNTMPRKDAIQIGFVTVKVNTESPARPLYIAMSPSSTVSMLG